MRISVVNFCSTALEMLDFSSRMLVDNAGTNDFDYVVVTWNPSKEVDDWCKSTSNVVQQTYETNFSLAYVPNLRAMFNCGFDAGYALNDYVAIVNTDMAFGRDWLINLTSRANEGTIPNSLHISPIRGSNIVTANCGVPTADTFKTSYFWSLHDKLFSHLVESEDERGGWEATQSLPYVIHHKWWDTCGPWNPIHVAGALPPDRQFFQRVHEAGAKYVLCHDSICYHHEAVERRTRRPIGVKEMTEGV